MNTNVNMSEMLPTQFASLVSYMKFAQPTTKDRVRVRTSTRMEELQEFYNVMLPKMEEIMEYLKNYPPFEKDLPDPVRRLVWLGKAFMDVGLAVELFHAPDEPGVWGLRE